MSAKETESESFSLLEKGTPTIARKNSADQTDQKYEVCFENITQQVDCIFLLNMMNETFLFEEEEYTVTISTELNGRTVTQTVERFPMGQPD